MIPKFEWQLSTPTFDENHSNFQTVKQSFLASPDDAYPYSGFYEFKKAACYVSEKLLTYKQELANLPNAMLMLSSAALLISRWFLENYAAIKQDSIGTFSLNLQTSKKESMKLERNFRLPWEKLSRLRE
ncbi:5953_t:CDS:2 [Paraglomus brasilianum]|uniref:5953_t:CDS:1 n=1 Tax=Paraglomus brasilianum TaxID=144538 RepID=A0A9N8VYM1_9GLOM|nr:5953_t:CDS:2 [Paraglomus brasilianum]